MKKIMRTSVIALFLSLFLCMAALAQPDSAPGPGGDAPQMNGGPPMGGGDPMMGGPMQSRSSAVEVTGQAVTVDDTYFRGTAAATEISDFTIFADNESVVGITVNDSEGEGQIVVRDGKISLVETGTGISLSGRSHVLLDGVVVWNRGNADGLSVGGSTDALVKDTVIYGAMDPETFRRGAPFALGLNSSMRVVCVIGDAQVLFKDSIAVSGSWAALSTDAGSDVCLRTDGVLAGIGALEVARTGKKYTAVKTVNGIDYGFTLGDSANYNSGYISYCDTGFHNYYNDSQFYATDYDLILSTGDASATFTGDATYVYSDRIGVMWHKNDGGTVDITDGKWYARECLFMMKGYSSTDTDGCHPTLIVDGTDLQVAPGGVLLQVMTSDDCGLNYEALQIPEVEDDWSRVTCLLGTKVQKTVSVGFPPTNSYVYLSGGVEVQVSPDERDAWLATHPGAKPVMVDYEPQETATAIFKNLTVTGDIYNGVWEAYQALDVTFENAAVTGIISSAQANHADKNKNPVPGGTVVEADTTMDGHLGFGRLKNTPAPAVNNPISLTLAKGAAWTVSGTSYLNRLVIDEGASITAAEGAVTMTVDGVKTPIEAGAYTGRIEIMAVPGA